jgi:hypothetical protein
MRAWWESEWESDPCIELMFIAPDHYLTARSRTLLAQFVTMGALIENAKGDTWPRGVGRTTVRDITEFLDRHAHEWRR